MRRYPFGPGGLLDLECARRSSPDERPLIRAASTRPLELQVRWQAGSERMELPGGGEVVRSGVPAAAALGGRPGC